LDLTQDLDVLFRNLHVDSIRRKIQRGRREKLEVDSGDSEALLTEFYRLHVVTRRRQCLPPHPYRWFQNLLKFLKPNVAIRIAKQGGNAIAAVMTVEHGDCLTYKYGCSDAKFHNLGGMPFVFWDMITDGKRRGMKLLDLGRSRIDNPGLI